VCVDRDPIGVDGDCRVTGDSSECRSFGGSCYSICPENTENSGDNGLICIRSCDHRTPDGENCLVGSESLGSCLLFEGCCYSSCPSDSFEDSNHLFCIVYPTVNKGGNNDNNKSSFPWWILLIILGILALVVLILVLLLKRKKKNPEIELDVVNTDEIPEVKEFASLSSTILSTKDEENTLMRLDDGIEKSSISSGSEKMDSKEEDLELCRDLLFTPVTYSKQKDEFFVCEKKPNNSPFFIKARMCDSPHEIIVADKRRTLFSFFSEIQV
jgi:hypothetical protein